MLNTWKSRARQLKRLIYALYVAYRDPRTPIIARIVAACVIGYAISPIDLIPDPIPLLGYLDDLILLPLGIALAIRLIPVDVWKDAQQTSASRISSGDRLARIAGVAIVLIWFVLAIAGFLLIRRWI